MPVKSRVIGKEGKSKKTIENISGCDLIINSSAVGIIGPAIAIEKASTAIINLIRGSKHSNVYNYLEKNNSNRKLFKKSLNFIK